MDIFNIEPGQMIQFGINETIYIPKSKVSDSWRCLKETVIQGNNRVFIRGYGRDAKGTDLYLKMYKELFGHNNFWKDSTNNAEPTKTLKKLTGYSRQEKPSIKYKQIRNYQVSHIFGKTKNPFLFNAPWNIAYVPKIMDPLTGHESKGELTEEFYNEFIIHFYKYYKEYVEDYNSLMLKFNSLIENYFDEKEDLGLTQKFKDDVRHQFSPIVF